MDWLLPIFIGIGLSAACGFRVFVPLLIMSIAARSGFLHLSPGFEWIGTDAAMIAFGIATLLEIGGYFIPWVDNLLDTIATPAAVLAGIRVPGIDNVPNLGDRLPGRLVIAKWISRATSG